MDTIRTRDDGILQGVHGPLNALHDRTSIAGRMGWQDAGQAVDVITRTLALLAEGKAVRLASHMGYCIFQPLSADETGATIPASRATVYNPEGQVIERTISVREA